MWLNFLSINDMFVYWPVVLIGLTVIVLFLPARVLYHRSRKWWAYSNVSPASQSGLFSVLTELVASPAGRLIPR
jgi:hypothetical protein